MERAEVLQVVRDKAGQRLELDPAAVIEDVSFVRDLGVDSLALVEYAMDLEDAFGIELPEDELGAEVTVGALVDVVVRQLDTALNSDG